MRYCYFCTNNIRQIEYHELDLLKRFLDPMARLRAHRRTGVCAKHQRQLALAVKRARFMALLPYQAA